MTSSFTMVGGQAAFVHEEWDVSPLTAELLADYLGEGFDDTMPDTISLSLVSNEGFEERVRVMISELDTSTEIVAIIFSRDYLVASVDDPTMEYEEEFLATWVADGEGGRWDIGEVRTEFWQPSSAL